jgi:acetyltransferase-like isoleucine patch superfamily enzyme
MSFLYPSTTSTASGLARIKRVLRSWLGWHIPVGKLSRPFFGFLYTLHVLVRELAAWSIRFLWYEPLFRSQCAIVGKRFQMEQLPYLTGRGTIRIGDGVQLSGKSSFTFSSRYGERPLLEIGDDTFIGHGCALVIGRKISLGKHCLIAAGTRIADFDGHPVDAALRRAGHPCAAESVKPVTVGDDVWIGNGALILKGVTIGDRAIIGARSVVTRDVPPDTIVAGNPARIVKGPPDA